MNQTKKAATRANAEIPSTVDGEIVEDPLMYRPEHFTMNDPAYARNATETQRSQTDNQGDYLSWDSGLDFTGTESLTRQEFTDDADVTNILNKYKVGGALNIAQRQVKYGESIDYSYELQHALELKRELENTDFKVPPELRHKYKTWRDVVNGTAEGDYQRDLAELAANKKSQEDEKARFDEWKAGQNNPPAAPAEKEKT